ncbi:hypothetical protein OIU78_018955 [Salix suchowensis]|nr:hypothetical protein OIU78_018955 [Salix suchowensis]
MEIGMASSSYSAKSSAGDGGSSMYQAKVGSEGSGGQGRGVYLVWDDLSVVIPNFGNGPTRRLLQGLRGYAEPGRIMAIMGPSGSGKSTLLDSLAGSIYMIHCFDLLLTYLPLTSTHAHKSAQT